jgi:hypothetical protein
MAGQARIDLLTAAGPGNGTDFALASGGKYAFQAESPAWNGGNAKLQISMPSGTWVDVTSGSLSANGMLTVDLPQGRVRAVVTTTVSVTANLMLVPSKEQ